MTQNDGLVILGEFYDRIEAYMARGLMVRATDLEKAQKIIAYLNNPHTGGWRE